MKHTHATTRRQFALLTASLLAAASPLAHAQAWPGKPLKIVVPFPPGGSTDLLARRLGEKLAVALGQPVVVENKPGAGGTTGADGVAKSPAASITLTSSSVIAGVNL